MHPTIENSLIAIWIIFFLSYALIFFLHKFAKIRNYDDIFVRTKSWFFLILIFSAIIFTKKSLAIYILAFISFLAFKEFISLVPNRKSDRRIPLWAYLSIPIQYYWASITWYGMFIVFIPVYMFALIAFRMVITQQTDGFLRAIGILHWGLMTTVFSLSHLAYLLMLPDRVSSPTGGTGFLLYLVFLTQFNDIAQYITGKTFGKRPILPRISPKKTWEGFLGGCIATTAAALLIAPFLTPFDWQKALLSGSLIALAGFAGDVTLSAIKRDIGVKDMSSMIPGHGGVMDRMDSLTFTAPQFFYFVCYFYGY